MMANQMPQQADRHMQNLQKIKEGGKQEPSLKGTFVSVMLLGLFLVLMWVSVFILFILRS